MLFYSDDSQYMEHYLLETIIQRRSVSSFKRIVDSHLVLDRGIVLSFIIIMLLHPVNGYFFFSDLSTSSSSLSKDVGLCLLFTLSKRTR